MNWDFRSDLPIYSQLIQKIKYAIASGELCPGSQMKSVRDLALEAKVNPNTMQRALSELERDGLLYSQRTSGRFVTEDISVIDALKSTLAAEHIKNFLGSMESIGIDRTEGMRLINDFEENENGNN